MSLRLTFIIHASYILFLETTDRATVRECAAAARRDAAIAVELQDVRLVSAKRRRPIPAVVADIVEAVTAVVAITRSRVPDDLICKTAGEIHTFVRVVVSAGKKG